MAHPRKPPRRPPHGGPAKETPLSRFLYDAYIASGLSYERIAARAGVSLKTVAAYIQGHRGAGGQVRQGSVIRAIAEALEVDPSEALRRAGVAQVTHVIAEIQADASLSRSDKRALLAIYREMSGRRP